MDRGYVKTRILIAGVLATTLLVSGWVGASSARGASSITAIKAALSEAPVSLDPQGTNSAQDSTIQIARQVFDTLVVRSSNGKFSPSLATRWSTPNPRTWVFNLRTGVRFTNGKPVTAADVVACLRRVVAQKGPIAGLWSLLSSVTAVNSHTVKFKTTQPLGTMLSNLTFLFIAPANLINQSSFWSKPIGSGPFEVSSFVPDQSATLVANPHYWGGAPKLHSLKFTYIPEPSTLTSALRTHEIDVALRLSPTQPAGLTGTKGLTVKAIPSYAYYYMWFNESRKPFTDARVRQAMIYAVPLQQIVKSIYGKYASVMHAPIPSTVFGYHKESLYPYDPAKAKQLLSAAGMPNGFTTTMMWQSNQAPFLKELATAFAAYWAKVGIQVQLQELDPATWLQRLLALNWDMNFALNSVLTGDADFALGRLYLSTAHRMGYSNPKLDKALLAAKESINPTARAKDYARAIDIIWRQAVGMYPLQVKLILAWRSDLGGFHPDPSGIVNFKSVG